ncbi:MAG: radical SAM protein [Candidatus Aceula meridiana]|nr:radical SAM protein [Candidatus Aceula meridiana]
MKVLFINAIDSLKRIETVYPPLGLGYLSAVLKRRFKDMEIRIVDRDIKTVLKSFSPDVVGISAVSQNYGKAIKMGRLCKSLQIPVFVGGVHITLLPDSLSPAFDFGVHGEAENTIIDVMEYLRKCGTFGFSDMQDIKGLILHSEEGVKLTEARPLIEDLDSIPLPDRDLLNIPIGQSTYMFTSRGCPYKCIFCASTRFWDNVRWFSADYVVHEIEVILKKYKPLAISFYDDLFIGNLPRLKKIVDLLCAKGIQKRVEFGFACRANLVNDRLIKILKPLKVSMVCMGLESGCQRTLTYLKGPGITVDQNLRAVEIFAKANIRVQGTFIIGSPYENEKEILETLDFIKKSRLSTFEVYTLSPFPGTLIWETARHMGVVSDNMDWGRLAVDSHCSENKILLSQIQPERLLALCNLFEKEKKRKRLRLFWYTFRKFLQDPVWMIKKIYYRYLRVII